MITSSNGNIFRVTGPLCGEFTGHRWIPNTKSQWRGTLMFFFFFICAWIKVWVNNREAGDLRRQSRSFWRHCVWETRPCTVSASTVITKFGSEFVRDWHWKSEMMTSWNRNAFDVTGQIRQRSYKGSVIRCFDVFYVVSLNKLLTKQSSCGWFQTPWRSCVTLKQVGVYASAAPMLEM